MRCPPGGAAALLLLLLLLLLLPACCARRKRRSNQSNESSINRMNPDIEESLFIDASLHHSLLLDGTPPRYHAIININTCKFTRNSYM
jgi:hypothetical protein